MERKQSEINILVIGDGCIDEFIYCDIERICPEAPVPVLTPTHKTENPGMAANVFANLKRLGGNVDLITNQELIKKTRYVDNRSGQMVIRVDHDDKCERISFSQQLPQYDAVVISDYCKGFLTEEDIKYISNQFPLTFLDTKKQLGDWCDNIDFIKINEFEHKKNFERIPNYPNLEDKIIITRGSKGCEYKSKLYPVPEVSVKDVSGAGDTFLASLVIAYVKSQDIEIAIQYANENSTIVVQKRGVAVI
jgi:bifunctional ADP-heptose synthase (sugar kinase/adenylyltransferase)